MVCNNLYFVVLFFSPPELLTLLELRNYLCFPECIFGSPCRAGVSLLLSVNGGRIGIFLWLHLCPLLKCLVATLHSGLSLMKKFISLPCLWWIFVWFNIYECIWNCSCRKKNLSSLNLRDWHQNLWCLSLIFWLS